MATRSISLEQVRVAEPCPVAWGAMKGDDQRRFCSHCSLHVHNLSAMPRDEAQRLICESAGRLCVAYVPDAEGGVAMTPVVAASEGVRPLEYAKQKRPRYGWRLVAMIAAIGGTASAFGTAVYRPKPAPAALIKGKMMVVGIMAPIPRTPTTHPAACQPEGEL